METPRPRPVDAVADAFVEDYCALDPVTATHLGVPGLDDRLTDYTPDGHAAREELVRRAHAAAAAAEPVDEREQVAKEAFLERLGLDLELYDAHVPQSDVSVIESPLHDIRSVLDLMDVGSEDGWAAVAARLAAFPATLDGVRATLLHEAGHGHVAGRRQLLAVADQVRHWTGQEGSGGNVLTGMVAQADVRPALASQLLSSAERASDAVASFGRFLADDLAGLARDTDACGRDRYRLGSRYFLGTEIDLEETYAWGWEELARIEAEMAAVAQRIVPGGSVDDAVEALDADPARTIEGKAAFAAWMQQLADRTVDQLAGTHFDIPEPVRRLECRIAPTSDGGIYYTGPSEDFRRPGRMWWAVPDGTTTFSTWREVTTVFHEGVPGHHLQVAQTTYRRERLNRWQRLMCWVSGHGEGWALYAERLMDELGHLEDPGDKLGMLDAQCFRAARVVVDIGMHLELEIPRDNPFGWRPGETWDHDRGLEFMGLHTRMDDAQLRFEVKRYLGWPGQAPSYKVGERIWLQARADAQARLGSAFDLRTFHREALDLGSIGLDPLRSALTRAS